MERQRGGLSLARYERDFRAAAKEPLSLDELLALLGNVGRAAAIRATMQSPATSPASEGWREAVKRLGGAFAEERSRVKGA